MNKCNWLTLLKSGSQMNKFVDIFFSPVLSGNLFCPKYLIEWASISETNQGTTRTYIFITLAKTIFFCCEIFAIRLLHQEACSCLCFTVSHAAMSWKFRKTIFPTVEFDRFDIRIVIQNNGKLDHISTIYHISDYYYLATRRNTQRQPDYLFQPSNSRLLKNNVHH